MRRTVERQQEQLKVEEWVVAPLLMKYKIKNKNNLMNKIPYRMMRWKVNLRTTGKSYLQTQMKIEHWVYNVKECNWIILNDDMAHVFAFCKIVVDLFSWESLLHVYR